MQTKKWIAGSMSWFFTTTQHMCAIQLAFIDIMDNGYQAK